MSYKEPANMGECEQRLATLIGEESILIAQLSDVVKMRQMDAYAYQEWKSNTLHRKATVIRERKLLEAWRANENRRITEERKREKDAKKAASLLETAERQARAASGVLTEVQIDKLVLRLYLGLERAYKEADIPSRESDTLAEAYAYLFAKGLLRYER